MYSQMAKDYLPSTYWPIGWSVGEVWVALHNLICYFEYLRLKLLKYVSQI